MTSKLVEARRLYDAGRKEDARRLILDVLKENRSDAEAWYLAALLAKEKDSQCQAKWALHLNPSHADARQLARKAGCPEIAAQSTAGKPAPLPLTKRSTRRQSSKKSTQTAGISVGVVLMIVVFALIRFGLRANRDANSDADRDQALNDVFNDIERSEALHPVLEELIINYLAVAPLCADPRGYSDYRFEVMSTGGERPPSDREAELGITMIRIYRVTIRYGNYSTQRGNVPQTWLLILQDGLYRAQEQASDPMCID